MGDNASRKNKQKMAPGNVIEMLISLTTVKFRHYPTSGACSVHMHFDCRSKWTISSRINVYSTNYTH